MNNKAQIMVLESILFAVTAILAVYFVVQLSPTTLQGGVESTDDLKILGDNALDAIYTEKAHLITGGGDPPKPRDPGYDTDNPTSKLVVYIITNSYDKLIVKLKEYLPVYVLFNLYISNGDTTIFLRSSIGTEKLPQKDPVSISHKIIAIDPVHLTGFSTTVYNGEDESEIQDAFDGYEQATYDVILEMWRI